MDVPQTAIDSAAKKELRGQVRDPRVFVGRGTYGDPLLVLYSADDRIEIGRYCSISSDSKILGGGEHNYRTTSSFPFYWYHGEDPEAEAADPKLIRYRTAAHKGATRIGADVWIGYGAMILSGVTVGHGAVLGAGALIASDVAPFSIMVGNPARCLKRRFDDATVERILAVRWWDWKAECVYQYQDLLCSEPQKFLAAVDALSPSELAAMYEPDPRAADEAYEPAELPPAPAPTPDLMIKRIARRITPPIIYSALSRLRR
jgi:acetyltransferase-like isoleucine patch superfamily enzyme